MTLDDLEKLVRSTSVPMPLASDFKYAEDVVRERPEGRVEWRCSRRYNRPHLGWAIWATFDVGEFETEVEAIACIRQRKTEAVAIWSNKAFEY